ncbi:hypothetical protein [Allokutzneria oryzae]
MLRVHLLGMTQVRLFTVIGVALSKPTVQGETASHTPPRNTKPSTARA